MDTEALNENGQPTTGRQTLYFGVALYESYTSPHSNRVTDSDSKRFTSAGVFWDWVIGKTLAGRCVWVMAHNWNYDAGILNTGSELRSRGWESTKYINGKPPLIVRWRKDGASILLVDTLNYFATSVSSLGDAVGLPKLDMPESSDDEAWNTYAWRDVEIIQKGFLKLRDFVKENDLGVMQPTLASQAMTAYRHRFMNTPILIHGHEKALELEREGYHGGRTEAFWRGKVNDTLYKLDINSMYPYIMRNTPLAHWFEWYLPSFKSSWWEEALTKSLAARCVVQTDEPCYGVVRDHKLIFPVGRFSTVLTTPEIHYAIEHGHLLDVGEFACYRQAVLFQDYVDYFYQKRAEYRQQGNASFDFMCKILMNSLYGKFGQNGRKWTETNQYRWDEPAAGVMPRTDKYGAPVLAPNGKPEVIHLRHRLGRTQYLEVAGESENSAPIIAAEITAHARMMLWNLIKQAGEENVYYVDTDSLVVNSAGYANIGDFIDAGKLGALKLEGQADSAELSAPKHFTFGSEWKVKGIRKGASQRLTDRGFEQEQFRSWDYHLSKGEDGFIDVLPIVKHVTSQNTKRVVRCEDGWTDPIELWEN